MYDEKQFGKLTKREYFAIQILQGFVSHGEYVEVIPKDPNAQVWETESVTKRSVELADELIEELNK